MNTRPEHGGDTVLPGLDRDVLCPECGYNLRGLTVPRCPECGGYFDPLRVGLPPPQTGFTAVSVAAWAILLGGMLAFTMWPLLLILLPIVAFFAVAGVQALCEIILAGWVLRDVTWRLFRAWWEGVLIGYGLCSVTLNLSGWALAFPVLAAANTPWPAGFTAVFALTSVEALVVQWWVVRRRLRQWKQPPQPARLILACLAAKAAAQIVWAVVPLEIVRFQT